MQYKSRQSRAVLIGEHIFNEIELASRLEVELEKFTKKVQIESRVLGDMANNHIIPTAVTYQNRLLENLRGLRETFDIEEYKVLSAECKDLIREISFRITDIKRLVKEMADAGALFLGRRVRFDVKIFFRTFYVAAKEQDIYVQPEEGSEQ